MSAQNQRRGKNCNTDLAPDFIPDCQAGAFRYHAIVPVPTIHELTAQLSPRRQYLVGVSGGADSVALLQLLVAAGFRKLIVCHIDHQLRGAASRGDAKFVEKLCHQLGLPLCSTQLAVKKIAAQRGESLETAARHLRQEFFAEVAREKRCPRLLLAHHADDQAETLLWNILRGSHGAKAMRSPQTLSVNGRQLEVFRPLLQARRADLRGYLQERGLAWREDASNAAPIATRNRLRNEALPLLCEIAQRDVTPMLLRQIEAQDDQESLERWAIEQAHARDPQGRLHVPALKLLPTALQSLVFRDYLQLHQVSDISRDLLDRCLALLTDSKTHSINLPGGKFLRRKEGRITLLAF